MNMKVKLALNLACILVTASVAHAELTPTVGLSLDYNGKYVWRGQNLTDDPVLQPGASIGLGNLTLGIWGNLETTAVNGEKENSTEVDYSLDYSDSIHGSEILGFSVGVINYDFPEADAQTYEVYAGLSVDTFLSPSVTYDYDYDDVDSDIQDSTNYGGPEDDLFFAGIGISMEF